MYADVSELWREALLSGRYPQDIGYLETWGGFTASGVLADLAYRLGLVAKSRQPNGIVEYRSLSVPSMPWWSESTELDTQTLILPRAVCLWAGISEPNPLLDARPHWDGSMYLSDFEHAGWPFPRLWALIETQREGPLAVVPRPQFTVAQLPQRM